MVLHSCKTMSYTKFVVSCVKIILDEAKSFSLLKIVGNDVFLEKISEILYGIVGTVSSKCVCL
jgi:hypothetical protein